MRLYALVKADDPEAIDVYLPSKPPSGHLWTTCTLR
jgi:hypothetical protein